MSKRAGGRRRAQEHAVHGPVWRSVLLILGGLVFVGVWVVLVGVAIHFGRTARAGSSDVWWLVGVSTLAAAVCLLLVFTLLVRGLTLMGLLREYRPRRALGRRAH
ncbi:MAG: hypothetical protein ACRDQ1_06335 [Sciscionella sp.]